MSTAVARVTVSVTRGSLRGRPVFEIGDNGDDDDEHDDLVDPNVLPKMN